MEITDSALFYSFAEFTRSFRTFENSDLRKCCGLRLFEYPGICDVLFQTRSDVVFRIHYHFDIFNQFLSILIFCLKINFN